jgi:hypothetical protein
MAEVIEGNDVITAPGIAVTCIALIGRLLAACPEADRFLAPQRYIIRNDVLLTMFDGDIDSVVAKFIAADICLITVATPYTMMAFKDAVVDDLISAEGHFDTVGRRIGKIISHDQVVITSALPAVHRALSGP